MPAFHTIDVLFQNRPGEIAVYLIPYSKGAVLVDCGPGSTLENLQASLRGAGLQPKDVTHILLTHIHLDHAGAAGFFAAQGAQVIVHPLGAQHLLNPEKLLASARRIYAERMDVLWGRFWKVSKANLLEVEDGAQMSIGELRFTIMHTPGHAEHHIAYGLGSTCFTGDIAGVRFPGPVFVNLPFVPPETHFGKWRESLKRLQHGGFSRVALSHFGSFGQVEAQLAMALRQLDDLEFWLEKAMSDSPPVEILRERYAAWLHGWGIALEIPNEYLALYEDGSTIRMAGDGLFRYWHKVRMAT